MPGAATIDAADGVGSAGRSLILTGAAVDQTSVSLMPSIDAKSWKRGATPSLTIVALPSSSCPVTTRRILMWSPCGRY